MSKYIFVTGGVVSSLGKGVSAASLGALLQSRGYSVHVRKFDPYLNVDPGTMSPLQHGEVYVTNDGFETDLDLGYYERFLGVKLSRNDSVSGGRIYWDVLNAERHGDYLGATVQMIPHVTNKIKEYIGRPTNTDFVICEIGGTVGDIEGTIFLYFRFSFLFRFQFRRGFLGFVLVGGASRKCPPISRLLDSLDSLEGFFSLKILHEYAAFSP